MATRTKDPIYDDQASHDDLGFSPEQRQNDIGNLERSWKLPSSAPEDNNEDSATPKQLNAAEAESRSSGLNNLEPSVANGGDSAGGQSSSKSDDKKSKLKGSSKSSRNKKLLIGGGVGGGIVALIIGAIITLIPLKIIAIVDTLQEHFFASNESAITSRTQKLFDNYIKKQVLPGIKGGLNGQCLTTKTADRTCFAAIPDDSKLHKLYRAWSDARLENKMANDYGIEFSYNQTSGTRTLKAHGIPDIPIDNSFLTNDLSIEKLVETKSTSGFRQAYRAEFSKAMDGESHFKKVFYRFKLGRLLERKYGVRRCIFACSTRDDWSDWKTNKKKSAELLLVRRIVEPHAQAAGIAFSCIIDGACADELPKLTADGKENQDALERKLRTYLEGRAKVYSEDEIKTILKLIPILNNILDKGVTRGIIELVLNDIFEKEVGTAVSEGIPYIGWIDVASKVILFFKNVGPKMKRWGFVLNITSYISTYMMYRTFADEMKSGHVDPEIVGSMLNSLGDETGDVNHRGQAAEVSPLFQDLFDPKGIQAASLFDLISPSAYAQTTTPPSPTAYTCDSNKTPYVGEIICPEESIATDNWLTEISNAFQTQPLASLAAAATFWKESGGAILAAINSVAAPLLSAINNIISSIPGISQIKDMINSKATDFIDTIAKWMFPTPISPNSSGARLFNGLAGGADGSASQMGQDGLGGQLLSAKQVADIRNAQTAEYNQEFASQPFFYRMFNTSDSHSLVSQLALSMPSNTGDIAQSSFASLIANPLDKLLSGFASFFSKPKLLAAASNDPFGIPQFGYAIDDPILNMDPAILTESYCNDVNKLWVKNEVIIDPATGSTTFYPLPAEGDPTYGIDVHHYLNPCKLEEATIGSVGAYFDRSTLSTGDANGVITP